MRSLPGIGVVVSTTLLSEAAAVLAQSDVRAFRCYAGIAPITKQSGKSRRVFMRYGCNHRIRELVTTGLERAFNEMLTAGRTTSD